MLVNKRNLSAILGVTESSLTTWQNEEQLPINQVPKRRGQEQLYDTVEVIRWMIARAAGDDLNAEKTRLTREQADKTAIENARLRAELVPAVLVERAWGKMLGAFRARLLRLPAQLATSLVNETEHSGFQRVLRRGVHDCLNELCAQDLPRDADEGGGEPRSPPASA